MKRSPLSLLALLCGFASCAQGADKAVLARTAFVPLPGVEGRMDHFAFDSKRNRLWVSALENHSIEVVDLRTRRVIKTLPNISEPQGILYLPQKDFVFVASRGDGTLRSFDAKTFAPGPWVDLGRNADNIRFNAQNQTLYVGSGGEPEPGALSAIPLAAMLGVERGGVAAEPLSKADIRLEQPRQAEPEASAALSAHPESFQLDPARGRIYVNGPDEHTVNVLSVTGRKLKVESRWAVKGSLKNHPMVFDAPSSRLFVIARIPPLVFTYETKTGRCIGKVPCVGDGDDAFYDASTHRLFVIGGEGFVDVFEALPNRPLRLLQHLRTASRARTGTFIPALRLLAVAVPHVGKRQAHLLLLRVR